jgi:hypothetical protein
VNDRELTDKVLEAIGLRMKEGKLADQLTILDNQIRELNIQKGHVENIRRQFTQAQQSSVKAAETAKAAASQAIKEGARIVDLADKAMAAAREAETYANLFKSIPDFDAQIAGAVNGVQQANIAHQEITKDLSIIKARKDQLKKEGINIPMDAKSQANVSI